MVVRPRPIPPKRPGRQVFCAARSSRRVPRPVWNKSGTPTNWPLLTEIGSRKVLRRTCQPGIDQQVPEHGLAYGFQLDQDGRISVEMRNRENADMLGR